MNDILLADLTSGAAGKLAEYAIKCLAVAGGFLVGYFAGKGLAWALDRWVFAKKAPAQLKQLCSVLCGLALALVVALIVFGSGGGGLFGGGGGSGKGTDPSADKGKSAPTPQQDPKVETPKIEPKPADPKPTPGDVPVTILSGADVVDGKFYRVGTDPDAVTLEGLKAAVKKRPPDAPPVVLVFRFAGTPLSDTHTEMRALAAWVREAKLLSRFE